MLKRAHFLILLLFFSLWQPAPAQNTDIAASLSQGDSARVIYLIRGRVYIDKGSLDGIDNSWQVAVTGPDSNALYLPFLWIGDDISSFSVPDSLFPYFQTGLEVGLSKLQNRVGHGYKITLAYPHMPAMPHEGAGDYYDREFQGLISPNLQVSPLKSGVGSFDSMRAQNELFNFYGEEGRYCRRSEIRLSDAYYTLQYYRSHLVPGAYSIKYLPALNDPLDFYWDTTMNACIPSQTRAGEFENLFNCARFNILQSAEGGPISIQIDTINNPGQIADSQPYYGSDYGPYFIWEKNDDRIILLRNNDCPGNRALPDTIIIKVEPDYLKRKLMFQLGEIDFFDLNSSDLEQYKNSNILKRIELNEAAYLTINNLEPMLSDGMLMTALSYLINKDGLCRIALGKSAVPLDNLIGQWGSEIRPMYKYDKNKGQSLIKNFGKGRRYLSLFISPDDYLNRRTAEYIKGILERQNIYVTIYSEMQEGQGRSYDLFQQFDMMIGRIDLSLDSPVYILNQAFFHYDMNNIARNRSLYYSENIDSIMKLSLKNPGGNENALKESYRGLTEFPGGLSLFKPLRQVASGIRIRNFKLTKDGFIDFSSIEIKNEAER